MARQAKASPRPILSWAPGADERAQAYREHPQLMNLAGRLLAIYFWEPHRPLMDQPEAAQLIRLMDYYTGAGEMTA